MLLCADVACVSLSCGADEQLHYARATYTREQLDKWQADWNAYFAKYGMETPAYAHRITAAKKDEPGKADGVGSTLAA